MRLRLPRGRRWWPRGLRGTHRKARRQTSGSAPVLQGNGNGAVTATGVRPVDDARATPGTPWSGRPRIAAGTHAAGRSPAAARVAIRTAPNGPGQDGAVGRPRAAGGRGAVGQAGAGGQAGAAARADAVRAAARAGSEQPWFATARRTRSAAGQRDCGCLEKVLVREWAAGEEPVPQTVTAINRLAALPLLIKEKLAAGLDAIHVGSGGVPDLDHMGELAGVPLPSGQATWDACAGAYGDRKILVGSRPSPTPDVMCHEVGHALDDIDGSDGGWQSDSPDFHALYGRCRPHLASEFHRHGDSLGRREFFADAFAAIASAQRPALVEMLSGDTRTALDVMLYFNVRYGL